MIQKERRTTALETRLEEAEEALNAIRRGEVDALVVNGKQGKAVYTLEGADHAYRVLIEWINEGAATLTETGTLLYCNRCFATMVGAPLQDIITLPLEKFVRTSEFPSIQAILARAHEGPVKVNVEIIRTDGQFFPAQLSVNQLPLSDKETYCVVLTDLTAQNRVAKELQEARKLEALGRLAGGVAHDFNNLVTGIQGIVQEVQTSFSMDDARRQDLDEVIKAANRAFSLTKQLLAFASRQVSQPRLLDVSVVIVDVVKLLQRLIGEHIRLDVETLQAGPIRIDPSHLEQILLNLAVNARDAMPQGGSIRIETQEIDCHIPDESHASGGRCVEICFRDTGTGMSPELLTRVFEPFFSTKDQDKGTGLGLATVYGIVRQNKGRIIVASIPGKGTVFRIHFPVMAGKLPVAAMPKEPDNASLIGHETLLVVEDEDIVRRVVTRRLLRCGYHVLEARNGRLALQMINLHQGPLDMIITDVLMPEMNGKQLVDQILPKFPNVEVLYMSGYPREVLGHQNVLEAGTSFINKTELNTDLVKVIRKQLDQRKNHAPKGA